MIEKLQKENASLKTENKSFESRLVSIESLLLKNVENKPNTTDK